MHLLLTILFLLYQITPLSADNNISLESLYINPENKKLSEVIIFYNTDNPCENCDKTINLLISILEKNYKNKLHAYLINTANHPEYMTAFDLKGPINLVIIRISDGASFGYKKLTALESKITSPQDFALYIKQNINNFLSFPPQN